MQLLAEVASEKAPLPASIVSQRESRRSTRGARTGDMNDDRTDTEKLIDRALALMAYMPPEDAAQTLRESGADPAQVFLAVKAAELLERT